MTPEARAEINRANARKSTGPKTAKGKARSSMNARKHGMRSKRESIFIDSSYAYEERRRKWMAICDAQNDMDEFLVAANVGLSFDIERAERADAVSYERQVERADAEKLAHVHELGRQLFRGPFGPTATYGIEPSYRDRMRTSGNERKGEPYTDPAELVAELEASAAGCRWMLEEWAKLRKRAEKNYWFGPDRLRAIRLLGRQPIDVVDDRRVAVIFIASDGVNLSEESVFDDLRTDLDDQALKQVADRVKMRWPGLRLLMEPALCRRLLIDLVDQNVERLNAMLEVHEENSDVEEERAVGDAGFESSPRGNQIRQNKQSCIRLLYRGVGVLEKRKRTEDRIRTEDGGRRTEDRIRIEGGGRRTEDAGREGGHRDHHRTLIKPTNPLLTLSANERASRPGRHERPCRRTERRILARPPSPLPACCAVTSARPAAPHCVSCRR